MTRPAPAVLLRRRGLLGAVACAAVAALAVPMGGAPASASSHRPTGADGTGHRQSVLDTDSRYAAAQRDGEQRRKASPQPTSGASLLTSALTSPRYAAARRTSTSTSSPTSAPTGSTTSSGTALVLYDTVGEFGFLGEFNAIGVANLAGHFGAVKTAPISSYTAGQMESYAATFYIGSTYDDGSNSVVPAAFSRDVATSSKPVVWAFDNIWRLSAAVGADVIQAKYGWDPSTSYFTQSSTAPYTADTVTSVTYKGQVLNRSAAAGAILSARITDPSKVTVLATAHDSTTNTDVPWAVRSGNLTYVGDQPFAYVDETDRTMAFADLLFDALAPATAERHRALVRLEDISPASNPTDMRAAADYLYSQRIPFGFNIIPVYKDPKGYYNGGRPKTIRLSQAPDVVSAIKYLLSHGGTMVMEGWTHQYSNIADPYTGVTGDDFEFYLSHIDSANNVILDGPVAEDSGSWASGRINSGFQEFAAAKLAKPTLLVVPHYAASQADYKAFVPLFKARYDRTLYFSGQLSGSAPNYTRVFGQYFPYVVKDVYGQTVVPENLGDYEPVVLNNHPQRLPADIVAEAKQNLVVRDGFASFFYDPSEGVGPLREIVSGIQGLGAYSFVSPGSLVP